MILIWEEINPEIKKNMLKMTLFNTMVNENENIIRFLSLLISI